MELKLNIYNERTCRSINKTVTANDFELSTGVCEDVLDIINIDMFEGGLSALSDESATALVVGIIKNGYPFFIQLIKEIFDLTDEEAKFIKMTELAKVVMDIAKYSFNQLAESLGSKTKN